MVIIPRGRHVVVGGGIENILLGIAGIQNEDFVSLVCADECLYVIPPSRVVGLALQVFGGVTNLLSLAQATSS